MTGRKQTLHLVINRLDAGKYLSLIRCSDTQIKIEFQAPEGIEPEIFLERQPEIEYSVKELQLNSDRLRCKR